MRNVAKNVGIAVVLCSIGILAVALLYVMLLGSYAIRYGLDVREYDESVVTAQPRKTDGVLVDFRFDEEFVRDRKVKTRGPRVMLHGSPHVVIGSTADSNGVAYDALFVPVQREYRHCAEIWVRTGRGAATEIYEKCEVMQ